MDELPDSVSLRPDNITGFESGTITAPPRPRPGGSTYFPQESTRWVVQATVFRDLRQRAAVTDGIGAA
jgi:hypothetical protein